MLTQTSYKSQVSTFTPLRTTRTKSEILVNVKFLFNMFFFFFTLFVKAFKIFSMQFLQSRKSKNIDESFCAIAIYLVITKNELNVYTTCRGRNLGAIEIDYKTPTSERLFHPNEGTFLGLLLNSY